MNLETYKRECRRTLNYAKKCLKENKPELAAKHIDKLLDSLDAFCRKNEPAAVFIFYHELDDARAKLTPREATIISYRYGLLGTRPKTLTEVGKIFGVTRERVRQVEAKALEKFTPKELQFLTKAMGYWNGR